MAPRKREKGDSLKGDLKTVEKQLFRGMGKSYPGIVGELGSVEFPAQAEGYGCVGHHLHST